MRNAFLAAVVAVACLNSYFCNKAVESATLEREQLAAISSLAPAVNRFRLLFDEALKLAAQQYQRVKQLEKFITDMGLPVPAEDAAPVLPENAEIEVY